MVRKLLIIVFCTILTSCYTISDYGSFRPRFIRKKNKPLEKEIFTMIDTNLLYKRISFFSVEKKRYILNTDSMYSGSFLKFYANGRFSRFNASGKHYIAFNQMFTVPFDINDPKSLDPKLSDAGYFEKNKDSIVLKSLHWSAQSGGYWAKSTLKYSKNDTLIISDGFYISKYVGIKLPKEFLKAQPDW